MKKPGSKEVESGSRLIDAKIEHLGDWRGHMLARLRALVMEAHTEIVEECKWIKPSNPWEWPYGLTTGSSAPAKPTRVP